MERTTQTLLDTGEISEQFHPVAQSYISGDPPNTRTLSVLEDEDESDLKSYYKLTACKLNV